MRIRFLAKFSHFEKQNFSILKYFKFNAWIIHFGYFAKPNRLTLIVFYEFRTRHKTV